MCRTIILYGPDWRADSVISWYYRAHSNSELDKKRAAHLTGWARARKTTKSEIIREIIDRSGPIVTGDDLIEWADASVGRGLGLKQKNG